MNDFNAWQQLKEDFEEYSPELLPLMQMGYRH